MPKERSRERGDTVVKKNMTFQVREHVLRIGIILFGFGIFLSPGAPAKAVQALLGIGLGKTAGINSKVALQLHLLQKWLFSWRYGDSCVEADATRHWRLRRLGEEQ